MQREFYAVFDFDGTISTLRSGWEQIMQPMMLEVLCPGGPAPAELEEKVAAYIDQSTGIQTAYQMQWLAQQVAAAGGEARDVWYYKDLYNRRLLRRVAEKKQRIASGADAPEDYRIAGSAEFLRRLHDRGCRLLLASGTDDADVKEEARCLGVDRYFARIQGAPAGSFRCSKEEILGQLMEQAGPEAAVTVFGDGKVEIALAKRAGALAVGIASDEAARRGIDAHKRARLEAAGADVIRGDFTDIDYLEQLVLREVQP